MNSTAQLLAQLLPQLNGPIALKLITQKLGNSGSGPDLFLVKRMGWPGQNTFSKMWFCWVSFWHLLMRPGDLIIATTNPPFNLWVLALVRCLRSVPVRYWVLDVYPDLLVPTRILSHKSWIFRFWRAINRWALCKMDKVMVIGRDMQSVFDQSGIPPEKLVFQPLWSLHKPCPDYVPPVDQGRGPLRILYSGNIGLLSDLNPLVDALAGDPRFVLAICGDGLARAELEQRVALSAAANIHFEGWVPLEALLDHLQKSDICVVSLRPGLQGLAVPCKLYGILAAGRPVLALVPHDSEVAAVVSEFECGWVIHEKGPSLSGVLSEILNNPKERARRGQNALRAAQAFTLEKALPAYRTFFQPKDPHE